MILAVLDFGAAGCEEIIGKKEVESVISTHERN